MTEVLEDRVSKLIDRRDPEKKRYLYNIWMFIASFTLSNLMSGVIYDTYVNYLQEVSRDVATSFWSYYGYATFISAMLVLLVNKIGYKWTLFFCPLSSFLALVSILYVHIPLLYQVTTVLSLIGLQLHYVILPPYLAAYTKHADGTLWYSRTYWIGYIGWALTTCLGGLFTVFRFSARAGISFSAAQELTKYLETLEIGLKQSYLTGNRDVLLITAVIAAVSLIPVLLIKEKREDRPAANAHQSIKDLVSACRRLLVNRYVVAFITYWALINFGMGLFTPYYTVFLNRNLHIDRSTASLLVSISYLAMVLFIIFTPKVVKRFGQVVALAGVLILSVPFMLLIANGNRFGAAVVPVVGIALFMRCGLANLGGPIDSSLPMQLVPEAMRPVMSSLVNVTAGLMSIVSGWFTGNYLFVEQEGYKTGYGIAAVLYTIGGLMMFFIFMKKYNRQEEKKENF